MFRTRFLLVVALIGATLASPLTSANSASISGTNCLKLNSTRTIANVKFTCVKAGKKQVWNKGVVISKIAPTPTSTPSPTKIPNSNANPGPSNSTNAKPSPAQNIDSRGNAQKYEVSSSDNFLNMSECNMQTSISGGYSMGWPRMTDAIPSIGNVRGVTLLVEFDDLKHNGDALRVWKTQQIPTAENFFSKTSYNQMNLKIDLIEKIYHLNKSVLSYNLDTPHGTPQKPNANYSGLIRDSILLADPDIDFSKYDFVNIVNPHTNAIGFEGASGSDVVVDGKQIKRATFGPIREYMDDPLKYNWMVHEGGHLLGLMHPYNNFSNPYEYGAYPSWDLMGDSLTRNSEFLIWNKYLLNWVNEKNLNCLSSSKPNEVVQLITPISENNSGNKGVFIRISDSKVLVIENRRASEFNEISRAQEGIVIYTVDGTIEDGRGAVNYLYSTFSNNARGRLLGTVKPGEIVKFRNLTIKVLSSVELGDYVKVTIS